ncbi:hypothetical protein ILUMI_09863 [Ignelater luminosus]|uniref:Uncharacterized protein n=1 Tax=Ignelater luminosus TaxID=2038154 RepID=A0A8K0CYY3_IGNLU|nr:hypothetical protein ILUMI_09863 [Ignelater luminosus]
MVVLIALSLLCSDFVNSQLPPVVGVLYSEPDYNGSPDVIVDPLVTGADCQAVSPIWNGIGSIRITTPRICLNLYVYNNCSGFRLPVTHNLPSVNDGRYIKSVGSCKHDL